MSPPPALADSYRGRKIVIHEQPPTFSASSDSLFIGQVSGLDDVFEGANRYQLLSLIRAHLDELDGVGETEPPAQRDTEA
ncbi:hypothetical protein D3875_22505 [Deinococcus cavernae]|uniref:Type II toxin-antitoxin system HicB family antitoxin n=1 Tax=Deinococcus cavernae TaxID=2320857 RepID=A0A418V051_9DEIO|nr:hypothetical protein [Deinococcus cavernae]RJF69095.1 hypothetical protein D3875_22505 [Deinococcus cavernae]